MSIIDVITRKDLELHAMWVESRFFKGQRLLYGVRPENGLDLRSANLRYIELHNADFSNLDLSGADLSGAILESANFSGANLSNANLSAAILENADLRGAKTDGANFDLARLSGAKIDPELEARLTIVPPTGVEIIGYKKLRNSAIAKLRIPAEAKRSNATGHSCRAEYAEVLEIRDKNGFPITAEYARFYPSFVYTVGQIVYPKDPFDENRWNENGSGIHFFLAHREAEHYF